MIRYPIEVLQELHIPTTLVVGYEAEQIRSVMPHNDLITYAYQEEQRGTGHALMCGYEHCTARHTLVINGDMPCITSDVIRRLIQTQSQQRAAVTFVTAHNCPQAHRYGKVVRSQHHVEIVEARDAQYDSSTYSHVNAGIYLFSRSFLDEALAHLHEHTEHGEIYITDLIGYASTYGHTVATINTDFDTIRGVNTLEELQTVETLQRHNIISQLFHNGVYCRDPEHTYIDADVSIAEHTWIEPGAVIRGNTHIARGAHIGPYAVVKNSSIGEHAHIDAHTHIANTTVAAGAHLGPFARVRKQSHIGPNVQVGNFVEVSQSTLGTSTKAKHLSYIGNTTTGSDVNIGAGTVICNFDGYAKYTTQISDEAFIGSNTTLVAPITLGARAIIGAGSVITTDIPEDALAIARERETIKEQYAPHLRSRQQTDINHHQEPDGPYHDEGVL